MDWANRPGPQLAGIKANPSRHPSGKEAAAARHVSDSNYFKSAQWSPDGTTILTSSADHTLRCFILPPDLLSPPHPKQLEPYTTHSNPEPVYACTFHPSYALSSPSSCLIVTSVRSLPIRLISPFAPGILSSYPLISPTTEAYTTPHSLLFNPDDTTRLYAGSESCVNIFDIHRNGEGPISTMRTTASRRNHNHTAGQGMKGIVSAMTMSGDGILAAGTFKRWIGLYDGHGSGDTVAVFPLMTTDSEPENEKGQGITQVLWSACSRYLCVAERGSDGISVWDIRGTGKRLAWLGGREAKTQQRLGIEMMGGEIWAGGIDGVVRVWEGLGMKEGNVDPAWRFQAHADAVSSATLHPTASLLATCSGQRHWSLSGHRDSVGSDSESAADSVASSMSSATLSSSVTQKEASHKSDSSLKLWALWRSLPM